MMASNSYEMDKDFAPLSGDTQHDESYAFTGESMESDWIWIITWAAIGAAGMIITGFMFWSVNILLVLVLMLTIFMVVCSLMNPDPAYRHRNLIASAYLGVASGLFALLYPIIGGVAGAPLLSFMVWLSNLFGDGGWYFLFVTAPTFALLGVSAGMIPSVFCRRKSVGWLAVVGAGVLYIIIFTTMWHMSTHG